MAKARPILADLSGSVGNTTWAHNKGGFYLRRRAVPTNPTSANQQLARAGVSSLSRRWSALGDNTRSLWTDYADLNPTTDSLGQARQLSGEQAYVQLNARFLRFGLPPVDLPPTGPLPTRPNILTVVVTAPNSIAITFAPTPLPVGQRLWLQVARAHSAGRSPNLNSRSFAAISSSAQASPAAINVASNQQWQAGQTVTLWISGMDPNGRISPGQRFDRISL